MYSYFGNTFGRKDKVFFVFFFKIYSYCLYMLLVPINSKNVLHFLTEFSVDFTSYSVINEKYLSVYSR